MFNSLYLEGFRGIRKSEGELKLSKFTLLIGANNSGKSSILEALWLLPYPYAQEGLTRRAVPLLGYTKPEVLGWLRGVSEEKIPRHLVYRYSGVGRVKGVIDGVEIAFEASTKELRSLTADGRELRAASDIVAFLKSKEPSMVSDSDISGLLKYAVLIPSDSHFLKELSKGLIEHWLDVEATGAHVKVVRDFVSQVVSDVFTESSVRFNDIVLRKELDGDVMYVRLEDLGDGVKRFLTAALWLEAIAPNVVLWDDLESAAHPALIGKVIEWLEGHDWQIIASTHSIDVLREVVERGVEAEILVLRKSRDDVLSYKALSVDDLGKLFEVGQDVRKLFAW
ncbi:MAG: hypothetical protein DRJ69_05090 [Thermoprotei archaeon]|nr:MAG: hypothetical protein DRJ69_05090 [Thermoprotei archaeon]